MTEAGLAILLIGLLIVGYQGVTLLEVGQTFLAKVYPEPERARTVAMLLVAPAFLLTCGALALTCW